MSDKTDVKKQSEKGESAENKAKKSPEVVKKENTAAAKKLSDTAKKPEKPKEDDGKKKEKKWDIGLGTTSAQSDTMSSSTTGITFENKKKNTRLSIGVTNIEEQERPGSLPKNKMLPGITFTKTF